MSTYITMIWWKQYLCEIIRQLLAVAFPEILSHYHLNSYIDYFKLFVLHESNMSVTCAIMVAAPFVQFVAQE